VTAIVFDCDGVLADTERDGHRPAFNQTFREFGLPIDWSEERYGAKLQIAGGKERMASELTPDFVRANNLPEDSEGQASALAAWHKRKTQIYTEMVAAGRLPARPGIRRIITAAQAVGWKLGVASTSAAASGPIGRPDSISSSPATSCRARSLRPTSICSLCSGSAFRPRRRSSSRTLATACWPPMERGSAAS
jgi:hypothetical protein